MATDSTNLPQGELTTDAGTDVAASELEFGAVQLAQVTADGEPVQMPQGQQVLLIPIQPGQTVTLPTASLEGLAAKIGPEGNLAIVVDGRTIIIQGYVQANEQSPVLIRTNDGDVVDVVDVVAQTDQNLDIQTAAGPAAGAGADGADGSGIYTPFVAGPGLDGLNAVGVLNATELGYRLIDDEYIVFVNDLDTGPTNIEISFDVLGGVVNEDDLFADVDQLPEQVAAKLVLQDQGNDGTGNDPFDGKDREEGGLDGDGDDGYPDADREPLTSIATVKVTFGPDIPGTLKVEDTNLPTNLTSEGEPIVYQVLPPSGLQGNGIVAFVDANKDGKFNELDGDRIVFDVKVQEKSSASIFHVAFTLYDNIDNVAPDANKDGAYDLLGGIEEILDLPVKITATDKDGTPLSTVMHLGVEDDVPFFGEAHYTDGGEGGIAVIIDQTDADIVHDETQGVQWWDSDDQSFGDAGGDAIAATHKATDAGFSLPYGDSMGSLFPKGIAQTQIIASFGADGATQEHLKDPNTANTSVRNSIFGALQDRADGVIDDKVNGGDAAENERPFELFMIKSGSGMNAVPTEDNLATVGNEGNLTIEDQPTNVTVSWTPWGGETQDLQVFLRQIDAQTIVGYVIPPEGEGDPQASREVDLGNGLEAVFVITIDDDGKMTFVQYHQINHSVDGPTFPDHDDEFAIRGEDGTPVIQVRVSDHDGDHATQPVNLVVQDDGPKFCGVDWGCDNDSKFGKGLIDEDKLHPNGNNDWAPGDDKGGKHADGKINFDFGVDKPGHVDVHGLKVTDSAGVVLMDITFSYDKATNTYTPSGDSDLKTADGHLITLEASLDESTGLLTIIGRDSEDGSEAFVYTLQTTGPDKGEFDFCLNEPLYHPYTDSDSENDGPQKSFEDNLKFELNVRGYDVDGDYADGNICINVDDDSPKAECDYECVVEGTHGDGELNYVTGNIVTGNGDTIFGNDGNNLDGNADNPGADQPYTISKISHDGQTYELSADHQTVSGLGPDDSFDSSTGILTIKTAEGGTLEIVLVSDNQDEVGDYKYTVPENAQHDHDIEAGPANEAASMSDAFDTVGEWVDSFAAAGITLIPSGGALGLRELDISGPEYRGIGVDSGNGDNAEVDNNGADEKLTLQIANPTNNIELTIGSLYNGAPDGGAMENLRWEVWNGGILIASGEILGTETGLVTLDIDTLLPFDKVVLKPADNGQGESANNSDFVLVNAEICCPKDKFTEEFEYTLKDADGDEACSTLKVEVKDTEPKVPVHDILTWVNVDEDGLPKGIGNNDSPLDAPGNSASFVGNIPFTPGADPVTIELSVVGGPDTGLRTLDGEKVLATWDSATGTLIGYIEGTDPSVAANQVFTMQITDAQTGAFTFDLLQEVKHADKDLGIINDTENLFDEFFLVKADIEDKDCDVASAIVKVVIDDDMPVISEHATVIVDEDKLPNGIEGGPGDDGVIGTSFNGNLGINFGADGGKSIAFSENGQPNLKSGGATVKYEWVGGANGLGTLIAYTGNNPNDASKQVFKVEVTSLENGGEYTFTLLKPLDHPDSDNNPNNNSKDDGKGAYEDNLVFDLKFSATDGDGDTVDGKLKVNVDDDSPTIEPGSGSITLHTDETLGGSGDAAGGGNRIENDEAGASIPAVISGQVGGTVIGFSQGNAAGLFSDNFGADGPAGSGSVSYALTILGGGVTGLTDTATGTAITLVAGANGVILGKNAGGDVVFAFSVNNNGDVTMVQYRAVNHGSEEAAPGEHDEVISFIENALGVTQTIVDKDGDATSLTRDISTSISIDDDGPKANDDYDSVKEGPGNAATGNVVTGVDGVLLGQDANGAPLDGTADNPGQDGPYTISKLTHDGQTYTLSADGSTVSGLQPGDSYNSGTGVLTIQTAAGGVLEIVLKSSTQSEVGEYKYTPGAPIHAEDVHVGPSVAQSNTAAFDNVSEWTSAFTAGGITLTASGGNLTIKNIDIAGPNDYRGVGVSTGLDNGEVDTDNEKLTMTFDPVKFPGGVNNAEVQLGALFDGVQFDSGSQEIVRWEVYSGNTLVASGQIVGDYDGLVTLDIDTATNFDKIVLTPLNNGAGDNGNNSDFVVLNVEVCKQEPVCEEFDYTLRDGDGDESSATLKINIEDTYPTVPQPGCGTLSFIVDEDGILGGNNNADPFDADEGDAGNDDGKFSGNIPFTAGADPVTIELFVGEPGTPGGGDTGLNTWVGNSLKNVFAAWDAATGTLIGYIEGTDPSDAANRVFTMHITDAQTGAFDFQLLKPVQHAETDAQGSNDNTENLTDRSFTVNVQIEDKDCDVAFTQVQVTIDDDMPTVGLNTCGTITLAVDESLDGNSSKDSNDASGGGSTPEGDEDNFNLPSALTNIGSVIGAAQAGTSGLFTVSPGADGLGSQSFSLKVTAGGVTGLIDTQSGQPITLIQNGNVIEGRVGATNTVAFAFTINSSTGEVSMAQYRAINHGNEEPTPGVHDEVKSMASGILAVVISVTDKDGDTVTAERDISGGVKFDDDGPKADIDIKHDAKIRIDESVGTDPSDSNAADENNSGDPTDIGYAKVGANVLFDVSDSDFGSDGEASSNARTYKLLVNGGSDSGLDDTVTGNNVLLTSNPDGTIIEGRVQGSNEVVFTVTINPTTGEVTVTQYRAVEHDNDNDHDESNSPEIMNSNKLLVELTVTDGDGDKDTDTADLGSIIKFEDDGPKTDLQTVCGAQIVLDESTGPVAGDGLPDNGGNPNDEAGNVAGDIAYAKVSGSSLFFDVTDFGSDKEGSTPRTYELELSSQDTSSGLTDTATGDPIYLHRISDTEIEGRVNTSGSDPVAFRITINPTNGEVTISQYRAVAHDNDGSSASDHDEAISPEIMDQNKLFVRLTVEDGDGDTASDTIDLGKLIKFEDDGPIARNDVDALDPIAGNKFESQGNVITGSGVTVPGIDDGGSDNPWTISKLESSKGSDSSSSGGGYIVNGLYGQLVMQSNGSYVYNFDENNTAKVPSGATEVFTYTLRDGDGDTDTATLTINMGEATVETSASVNNGAGGCIPEDTYGPLTLTADPGAGDRVTQITLTNVPEGWSIKAGDFVASGGSISGTPVYNPATHSITFNITGAAPGADVSVTLQIKGAPDSDVDGTGLVVGATVVDGVVTANDTTPFNVTVDAVADGDDKGDDGDVDALGVTIEVTDGGDANNSFQVGEVGNVRITASFDDFKDGSETHIITIEAPAGFIFQGGIFNGGSFTILENTPNKLVLQASSSGVSGVGDTIGNMAIKYVGGVEGSVSGIFKATVTTTETPTDVECNLDNNTDSATATTTVALASPPTVNVTLVAEGNLDVICVPEDSGPVNIPLEASTSAGSHLTTIVLSGFPVGEGWTFNFAGLDTDGGAGGVVVDSSQVGVNGTVTITFTGSQTTYIGGSFTATPPADSDKDLGTLTATVNAVDNTDASLTASDADQAFVRVDAIADGDDLGVDGDADKLGVTIDVAETNADGNTSFQVGEAGMVSITANYDDFKDGSETHTLTVQAPAGFTFNTGNVGTLPAGVVLDLGASDSDTLVFKVDSKDGDGQNGVGSFSLNVPVTYIGGQADGNSGNFSATVTATETPTDEECTTGNNTDSATKTDNVVIAKVPDTNVSLGVEGNGDPICVTEDTTSGNIPVVASTTAGSHLTTIVISGFPTGAAATGWTFNLGGLDTDGGAGGVVVNTSQLAASGIVTISFTGNQTNYSGNFTVTPPANSDLDLGTLTATVTAVNNTDPSVTDTDADTAYVRVDAVADPVTVSITASDSADADSTWTTGENGKVTVGATFGDFKDGSELHTVTITAPTGFQFTGGAGGVSGLPAGVTVQSANGNQVVLLVDSKDGDGQNGVGSFANVNITVQNVSAVSGSTGDFTAQAKAVEQNTTATQGDGNDECTDANNTQTDTKTASVTAQTNLVPIAYDDSVSVPEVKSRNVNVMLIIDRSWSMNDNLGGVTRFQLLQQATVNMLNQMKANGDVRVMIVTFHTTASAQPAWLSVDQAISIINGLSPSSTSGGNGFTNYEAALNAAIAAFADTDGRGSFADHDNDIYFLSDGVPTSGGTTPGSSTDEDHSLTNANLKAWDNFLENAGNSVDNLYAVGIGDGISASDGDLDDVADPDYTGSPADTDAKNPFGSVIIVEDEFDLEEALEGTVATKIEGNILNGSIENDPDAPAANTPDFLGDTPTHVSYFKYDGAGVTNDITITWDGVGNLEAGDVSGGKNVIRSGTTVSFDTDNGRMTFDFNTGKFSFVPNEISGGDKVEEFDYKLTDKNGDVSNTATLDITIVDTPGLISITDVTVDEGGTANVQVKLSEPAPAGGLTLNYTFTAGTATAGDDYQVFTSVVTVLAGQTTANIQVNAKNDIFFDDNETYNVVISNAPAGWTITDNTGVVTINDTTTLTVPLNSHSEPSGGWPDSVSDSGFSNSNNTKAGTGSNNDGWDGEGGDDTLSGNDGNDYLRGGSGIDTLSGGNGNDRLRGDADNDTITGGAGNDLLEGGAGFDKLDGGDNNDWLIADAADFGAGRSIHGGSGVDVLDIGGINSLTLTGNTAGVDGIEIINLEGGGDDTLSLKASDVVSITGGNELFIWGDSDDNVNLTNGGWSNTATNVTGSDGGTYDVFQNGAVKVYVETEVDVTLS